MQHRLALSTAALAILLLAGCASTPGGGDRGDDGNDGNSNSDSVDVGAPDDEFVVEFDADGCIVPAEADSDSFALVDSLPAGYEPISQPDCLYESGESFNAVYFDGGESSIAANNAALAAAGWEEVDTNTWDNQDVGTVSQAVVAAGDNPGGVPFGWKDTIALVNLLPY